MASYSSDQLVVHAAADGQLVPATQRARITSIQAAGVASSVIKLYTIPFVNKIPEPGT